MSFSKDVHMARPKTPLEIILFQGCTYGTTQNTPWDYLFSNDIHMVRPKTHIEIILFRGCTYCRTQKPLEIILFQGCTSVRPKTPLETILFQWYTYDTTQNPLESIPFQGCTYGTKKDHGNDSNQGCNLSYIPGLIQCWKIKSEHRNILGRWVKCRNSRHSIPQTLHAENGTGICSTSLWPLVTTYSDTDLSEQWFR